MKRPLQIAITVCTALPPEQMSQDDIWQRTSFPLADTMLFNDDLILQGAALASDAFFPFSWNDAVEFACKAGVGAIAHPGGSVRDQDAIDCCNKYGVVLVTTGVRHFKH